MPESEGVTHGIGKLLTATTAGLPNWAWILVVGGGIVAAIFVPRLFGGTGTSTDTSGTGTDTSTTPNTTDTSGLGGGYSGGGGFGGAYDTSGSLAPTAATPTTDTSNAGTTASLDSGTSALAAQAAISPGGQFVQLAALPQGITVHQIGTNLYTVTGGSGYPVGTIIEVVPQAGTITCRKYEVVPSGLKSAEYGWAHIEKRFNTTITRMRQCNPGIPTIGIGNASPGMKICVDCG